MTLRIKIQHGENQHARIRVKRGDETLAELDPNQAVSVWIWQGNPITVEEIPAGQPSELGEV